MKKFFEIVDIALEINADENLMLEDENELVAYRADSEFEDKDKVHRFYFKKCEELSEPAGLEVGNASAYRVFLDGNKQVRYIGDIVNHWENGYMRVLHDGFNHSVEINSNKYTGKLSTKTVLNALSAEHLLLESDGVILHASFIEHQGKAILFTAPSGTGKSTQAQLWESLRNAEIINGDRAVIRLIDNKAYACGIPFAGSSSYCKNKTMTLGAIVYLGQDSSTSIDKLTKLDAFKKVWEECTVNTWNASDVESATNIIIKMLEKVPVFYLKCTPDESAVVALEEALKDFEKDVMKTDLKEYCKGDA